MVIYYREAEKILTLSDLKRLYMNAGAFKLRKGGGIVVKLKNDRQEKFCLEFAKCGNATEAYKLAGYKPRSDNAAWVCASRLLRDDKVRLRLKELGKQIESEKIMGISEMQERLTAIARQEATEEFVGPMGETVERKSDFKAALKAMELLARMKGAFLDKKEIDVKGSLPVVIADNVQS